MATRAGTERLWPSMMTVLPFLNKVVTMRHNTTHKEQAIILVRLKFVELLDEFGE